MPKIIRSVSIDLKVWENARKLNLNVSGICEDALISKIGVLGPNAPASEVYREAWDSSAVVEAQKKRGEDIKWARETEKRCIEEDRQLWNEAYIVLKKDNNLPLDGVDRVRERETMFNTLKILKNKPKVADDVKA